MNPSFLHLERIERFAGGEMTSAEKEAFVADMERDAELRSEFEQYTTLVKGIELHGEDQLRKTIADTRSQLEQENFFNTSTHKIDEPMKPRFSSRQIFYLAAAVLIIVFGVVYFYPKTEAPNPAEGFAKYYAPENKITGQVIEKLEAKGFATEPNPGGDSLAQAITAYEAADYDQAMGMLNAYLAAYPDDKIGNMYFGLTMLQKSEYAQAADRLGPLAKDDGFEYQNTCIWYLALSLSQLNDPELMEDAKGWLQKLVENPDSGYKQEAEGMLYFWN